MIISPDEVLKIALAEEGYLEKSKTAYALNKDIIYDKNAGAGSDNITKFGYEMHKIEPKVMDFPAAWCFAEGTFVLTDCGYKSIEELRVGDKVLNANGDSFNEVTDIATRVKSVRKLSAYGSLPILTTDDHPFLGNQRLGVRKDWKKTKLDFYPANKFKKGDNVVITTNKFNNGIELSYDEAWLVGYFVGDGWKTTRKEYKICGDDKKEVEIFKHIKYFHKDKDYDSRTCHEYTIDKVGNSKIIPILNEANTGASNKEVPVSILFSGTEIKKAFLDGYLTADGYKGFKFSTVSKKLALGISKIVFDLGYGCVLRECARNEEQEIFDVRINAYRKIKVKPIIYVGQINKNCDLRHRKDRIVDNITYVPVKENVSLNTKTVVYNISTDGNHTFIANNLAVHNCDAFVDWCFMKAFGVDIAKNLLCGNFDDYTINSANYYKKANQWVNSNPLVGDQIFFKNTVRICHTGLVYKVDKRYIYTIEGNTSNKGLLVPNGGGVAKKVYLHTYVGIAGFGRPKYEVRGACALGDQNPDVVELQKRLMAKGYPLPKYGVDGQYGEETFRAVKQFRVDNDLRSSGVCDAECWLKLMK